MRSSSGFCALMSNLRDTLISDLDEFEGRNRADTRDNEKSGPACQPRHPFPGARLAGKYDPAERKYREPYRKFGQEDSAGKTKRYANNHGAHRHYN